MNRTREIEPRAMGDPAISTFLFINRVLRGRQRQHEAFMIGEENHRCFEHYTHVVFIYSSGSLDN
jgi:hypothetical protein